MKFAILLSINLLVLATGSLRPVYGYWETTARAPVTLPHCVGERATIILNRALRASEQVHPRRIEEIDDGRQTDFTLRDTRSCAGSMTAQSGLRYTGTWSYTRIDDTMIGVKFSLRPSN
jgi:hypothetical protein